MGDFEDLAKDLEALEARLRDARRLADELLDRARDPLGGPAGDDPPSSP